MRPRTYRVLELAVEDGVRLGWNRAHKHVDEPKETDIIVAVQEAVMGSICEWFVFDDEESSL